MNEVFRGSKDDITKVALDLAARGATLEDIVSSVLEMADDALSQAGIPELMLSLAQIKPVSLNQYYNQISEGKGYHPEIVTQMLQVHDALSWIAFASIYIEARNRLLGHRPAVTDANYAYKRVRYALGFKNTNHQFNI